MQFADHSIWSEIERLTKSIAWKKHFPKSELEDLVQNVKVRVWRYRDVAIRNGEIQYGYVKRCIHSEISEHFKNREDIYCIDKWSRSDALDDDMDCLRSEYNFFNDLEVAQLQEWLIAWCDNMPEGLRKDVCRCCLSGMTDGGSKQGKDIAAKLGRDQKSVSQALSYIRKILKLELAFL